MKNISILFITILLQFQNVIAQDSSPIISKMVVSEDEEVNGVKGILVSFVYRFPDFKTDSADWELEDKSEFKISTRIYSGPDLLQAHDCWSAVTDTKGIFVLTSNFNSVLISLNYKKQILEQFIPYAALKLNQGKNTIMIESTFEGRDIQLKKYKQVLIKEKIKVDKPAIHTFTLTLDSLEANKLNSKGQGWDYSLFASSAPDVEVRIMMGKTIICQEKADNSYLFIPSKSSKNITFTISEGDEVAINILDIDPIGTEKIASYRLSTYDKVLGMRYYINTPKENLKFCFFSFVVSK